eukprot:SAG11_NODE_1647_length_4512_cov_6.823929_4_plen_320_part_00
MLASSNTPIYCFTATFSAGLCHDADHLRPRPQGERWAVRRWRAGNRAQGRWAGVPLVLPLCSSSPLPSRQVDRPFAPHHLAQPQGSGSMYDGFKVAIASTMAARHHGGHELFGMYKANFNMVRTAAPFPFLRLLRFYRPSLPLAWLLDGDLGCRASASRSCTARTRAGIASPSPSTSFPPTGAVPTHPRTQRQKHQHVALLQPGSWQSRLCSSLSCIHGKVFDWPPALCVGFLRADGTGECSTKDPDGYQHKCCETGSVSSAKSVPVLIKTCFMELVTVAKGLNSECCCDCRSRSALTCPASPTLMASLSGPRGESPPR